MYKADIMALQEIQVLKRERERSCVLCVGGWVSGVWVCLCGCVCALCVVVMGIDVCVGLPMYVWVWVC